jgi:hypothetical protein
MDIIAFDHFTKVRLTSRFHMSRLISPITIFLVLLASQLLNAEQKRNYSYLYFENGYPTSYFMRRPQSEANLTARENPDLVFQTGYYVLPH